MLLAVQEERGEGVNRKQPAPKEQRAFLPRPEGGELVEQRQGAVAVLGNVRHREIISEEKIFQRRYGEGHQAEDGHACIARALGENGTAGDNAYDSGDKGIDGGQQREQKCK